MSLAVDMDVCAHDKSVFVWDKRAEIVGKRKGQHGHHRSGKIPGVAALECCLVQGISLTDIVADIGNGNLQEIATVRARHADGIIEIPGIGTVNGDKGDVTQIPSALQVFRPLGKFRSMQSGFGRKFARSQMIESD